ASPYRLLLEPVSVLSRFHCRQQRVSDVGAFDVGINGALAARTFPFPGPRAETVRVGLVVENPGRRMAGLPVRRAHTSKSMTISSAPRLLFIWRMRILTIAIAFVLLIDTSHATESLEPEHKSLEQSEFGKGEFATAGVGTAVAHAKN